MARPVWTGSISFGLVNVPVKAFTAVRDHDIHFNQLEKGSGSRIRNRKVAEKSGKEVDTDDIEMGFEIRKGRYVTFDKKELEELRPASTRMIEVTDFVALAEIDPIYYERTYWLGPGGDTAKPAYNLLLAAMEERERVAIGTVVMRNKQYLTAVRPLDGVLAMSTMRFADEVVPRADVDGLPDRRAKPEAKALNMATQLVESLAADWDPARYHDTYVEELRKRIKARDAGKEIVEKDERAPEGKVLDLMAALERSVEAAKGSKTSKKASARSATKSSSGKKRSSKARKSA
jgi:DNA end-binding protein Ku